MLKFACDIGVVGQATNKQQKLLLHRGVRNCNVTVKGKNKNDK